MRQKPSGSGVRKRRPNTYEVCMDRFRTDVNGLALCYSIGVGKGLQKNIGSYLQIYQEPVKSFAWLCMYTRYYELVFTHNSSPRTVLEEKMTKRKMVSKKEKNRTQFNHFHQSF